MNHSFILIIFLVAFATAQFVNPYGQKMYLKHKPSNSSSSGSSGSSSRSSSGSSSGALSTSSNSSSGSSSGSSSNSSSSSGSSSGSSASSGSINEHRFLSNQEKSDGSVKTDINFISGNQELNIVEFKYIEGNINIDQNLTMLHINKNSIVKFHIKAKLFSGCRDAQLHLHRDYSILKYWKLTDTPINDIRDYPNVDSTYFLTLYSPQICKYQIEMSIKEK